MRQREIERGGRIQYALGTEPSAWGTRPQDAPPSVGGGTTLDTRDLSGRLSPAQAFVPPSDDADQQARLALDLVVTTPSTAGVSIAATAPPGFRIEPAAATRTVVSNGLPTAARVPFTVTVPAEHARGRVHGDRDRADAGRRPITRTAKVVVRLGRCAGAAGSFCPVDLGRDYNHDGVATLDATDQGNFDDSGWSYAANLLPAAGPTSLGGIPYVAPSTAGTDANFVEAQGQSLALPAGGWATAYVLGATHHGNVDTAATVTYSDGSSQTLPLQLTDWAGGPAFGNTKEIAMPYRIRAGQGQDGPPVAIFGTRLALDPAKTPRSIALPDDQRLEIYALTLGQE